MCWYITDFFFLLKKKKKKKRRRRRRRRRGKRKRKKFKKVEQKWQNLVFVFMKERKRKQILEGLIQQRKRSIQQSPLLDEVYISRYQIISKHKQFFSSTTKQHLNKYSQFDAIPTRTLLSLNPT
jgi:hypothetical protein